MKLYMQREGEHTHERERERVEGQRGGVCVHNPLKCAWHLFSQWSLHFGFSVRDKTDTLLVPSKQSTITLDSCNAYF